jgi:hypothetical protein
MSDEIAVDQPVAGVNVHPEGTDAGPSAEAEGISESPHSNVENRDGKMYVDGVRVYTRDDTNKIAANARRDSERQLLSDMGVESIDQVKSVITTLQETTPGNDLNMESLRETVKKREQTVEELQAELATLKTDMVLKDHMGNLKSAMPGAWNADQQQAVLDLMRSRDMFEIQDTTFAIRHQGELLLNQDGDTPDYSGAVTMMGKTLGLPMAKQGIKSVETDNAPVQQATMSGMDEARLQSDPQYRAAYVAVRNSNKSISRSDISDDMIKTQMSRSSADGPSRLLSNSANSQTKRSPRRK